MRDGLFWVLLAALTVAKAAATLGTTELGIDGALYTDIAQYVRDGQGLLTGQSLYHKGCPSFPHPTSVYPLWPLLYGGLARLVPLQVLAHWLPATLYVGCLVAAYRLGARLLPQRIGPLHGGHALMAVLGLNSEFFVYTSLPYTEGLSWLLLLLFGHRLLALGPRDSLTSGAELGLWAGLLVLCRAQFLIVPIALFGALGLRLLRDPVRGAGRVLAALAAFCAVLAPHMARSATFLHDTGLLSLLRFDQAQVDPTIAALPVLAPFDIVDRLSGLAVAFDPMSHDSYFGHLYAWAPAMFLAPLGLWRLRRTLLSAQATPWLVMALFAMGGVASIHLAHKTYEPEWYFHRRHALVVLPAVFAGLAALWRLPGRWNLAGVALLLVGAGQGAFDIGERALDGQVSAWAATPKRGPLHAWLVQQDVRTVLISSPDAQRLAWQSPGLGFHAVYERTSPEVFQDLARRVDLVVLHRSTTRGWDLREGLSTPPGFVPVTDGPAGYLLYRRSP